jgi:hypothetical protein
VRLIPPIIEDESKIQAYVRDLAYKRASADIKAVLRTSTSVKGVSVELHEDLIPTRGEMNRILQVLHASLQPIPKFRDPRPWRYFDRIMHPNIRVVNENPGKEAKLSSSPNTIESYSVPLRFNLIERVSRQWNAIFAITKNYLGPVYSQAKNSLPSLVLQSPRQKVFESMFMLVSSEIQLRWDQNSIAPLEHEEGCCHDLSPLVRLSLKINNSINALWLQMPSQGLVYGYSPLADSIYSFARIRSIFKLCCWKKSIIQHQEENSLQLLLYRGKDCFGLQDFSAQDLELLQLFINSVAWLSWGEIGTQEVKDIESIEKNASNIWPLSIAIELKYGAGLATQDSVYTYSDNIQDRQYRLFSLLLERGCYVGREIGESWESEIGGIS